MKTINFVKNIVNMIAVVAMFFCATTASAQTKSMNSQDAAVVASLGNIHAGCYEVTLKADDKGYLSEKVAHIHSGLKVEVFGGFAGLKGESDNWADQSDNSVSFGGALTYNHHKRNWLLDLMFRIYAEGNTNVTIEEQQTRAFVAGFEPYIGINPCGAFRGYLGYGIDYINSTSKTDVDNESFEAHIPFKSNAFGHGPRVRLEVDLFTINTSKVDRGVKVTKKRSVSLVANGKYQFYNIDEPLGSTLKMQRWEVNLGVAVPLFF